MTRTEQEIMIALRRAKEEHERADRAEAKLAEVKQNAIRLLRSGSCERHENHIRMLDFSDFVAEEEALGCVYCAQEQLAQVTVQVEAMRDALRVARSEAKNELVRGRLEGLPPDGPHAACWQALIRVIDDALGDP